MTTAREGPDAHPLPRRVPHSHRRNVRSDPRTVDVNRCSNSGPWSGYRSRHDDRAVGRTGYGDDHVSEDGNTTASGPSVSWLPSERSTARARSQRDVHGERVFGFVYPGAGE